MEKKFLVTAITGGRTFNRLASLKEIDPSDYDWSTDKQLPIVTGWIGEILPPAQPMYGWQAEPAAFFDADGSPRRPSIRISCAAGQEGVTHVWVQVALKATGTIVFDSDQTPYDPNEEPVDGRMSWVLNGTFLPNETYQVRGRFISSLNDNQQWSAWLDVITFNILLANKDIDVVADLTKIGADVKKRFTELQQEMNDLLESYEQGLTAFSLVGAAGQIDREEIRAELGTARAEITDERRVRVTENEAMAQRVGLVSASVADANAKIITEQTARVSADQTLAESLIGVTAELGDRFAQGLIKFQAVAAPAGVDARFSVLLRGGIGQAYKDTGFFLELYTFAGFQRSRMAIKVDQFSVSDGTTSYSVLAIEGGVVKIINAIIDMAQINNLVVGTSNIAGGAITAVAAGVDTVDLVHGAGSPTIRIDTSLVVRTDSNSTNYTTYEFWNDTDGNRIEQFRIQNIGGTTVPASRTYLYVPPANRVMTRFRFAASDSSGVTVFSKTIIAQAFKR
ncbi:hypothetical protein J2768_002843 [Agrobacterium tumefaciens]|uniref:hypothetical protein n=1 Tax=Agrobacterium tumefaciens TaxID=358 RepID=UPI001AE51CCF|nr:hypothetical protein [Agrobacterium tumefaciens]MBP2540406.1 hypothetical protein [Agrobacterium tumefaciens]